MNRHVEELFKEYGGCKSLSGKKGKVVKGCKTEKCHCRVRILEIEPERQVLQEIEEAEWVLQEPTDPKYQQHNHDKVPFVTKATKGRGLEGDLKAIVCKYMKQTGGL